MKEFLKSKAFQRLKNTTAYVLMTVMVACGSNIANIPGIGTGAGNTSATPHLVSLPTSGHRLVPSNGAKFVSSFATFFGITPQATTAPSQASQSYDFTCQLNAPLTPVGNLIPIGVVGGVQNTLTGSFCNETQGPGGASAIGFAEGVGKQTIFDGTLSTFIVTASGSNPVQCRDITTSFPVIDNSWTAAFLDTVTHQVKISNQAPGQPAVLVSTCNNVGTDDNPLPPSVEIMFVKN